MPSIKLRQVISSEDTSQQINKGDLLRVIDIDGEGNISCEKTADATNLYTTSFLSESPSIIKKPPLPASPPPYKSRNDTNPAPLNIKEQEENKSKSDQDHPKEAKVEESSNVMTPPSYEEASKSTESVASEPNPPAYSPPTGIIQNTPISWKLKDEKVIIRVYFEDGTFKSIAMSDSSTVEEICNLIARKMELGPFANQFVISEVHRVGEDIMEKELPVNSKMLELVKEWKDIHSTHFLFAMKKDRRRTSVSYNNISAMLEM